MFPFDKEDRIRKPSMFGDFESFFADFDEYAERLMQHARTPGANSLVYGYRAYTGPDGKPIVEEYSNIPGYSGIAGGQAKQLPAPTCSCDTPAYGSLSEHDGFVEPYHEVYNGVDEAKVIADMPGVEEKDIKVQTKDGTVAITAESDYRKYAAEVKLPTGVKEKTLKTQYKNGVFELTYRKK